MARILAQKSRSKFRMQQDMLSPSLTYQRLPRYILFMSKYSAEAVAFLKAELLGRIADGTMPADAVRALHIGWRDLAAWKRSDPSFVEDLKDAIDSCADALAAKAVDAHNLALDAKSAQVMQRGLTWAAEKLAPGRYGHKLTLDDKSAGAATLLALIREAAARIAAHTVKQESAAIDVTPQEARHGRRIPPPQETHRP